MAIDSTIAQELKHLSVSLAQILGELKNLVEKVGALSICKNNHEQRIQAIEITCTKRLEQVNDVFELNKDVDTLKTIINTITSDSRLEKYKMSTLCAAIGATVSVFITLVVSYLTNLKL